MSHIRRYLLLAAIAAVICVIEFQNWGGDFEAVGSFRGANLKKSDWYPLIADTVNEEKITVSIDNKEYTSEDLPIFMDDRLNLMVPVDILTEGLKCSSHLYRDRELLVEKRSDVVLLGLEEKQIFVNEEKREIASPMTMQDGRYYVSIGEVSENIGYHYEWDMEKNQAVAVDASETASIFPARYDLREKSRIGVIKDQEDTGTCWAFASLSALESSMLPEEPAEFSVDHMSLNNSFLVGASEGGEYTMSMAYLLSWQGPVYERDDPFGDGVTTEGLSPVKHVQEVQILEGKDYEKIKEAVFQYGGVQTSLYSALADSAGESEFYSRENCAYCYIGTERPNHEVVIIGWDDNYPKENFSVNVEGNGAFICQNSWGDKFGEHGVFYVSYYDTNIGSHNVVYTKTEQTDNYDRIYQSDLCGWIGQIGFESETVYGANVYTSQEQELLSAVGFYAVGKNTSYKAYLVHNFVNEQSFSSAELIAEGSFKNAGFYTVPLSREVALNAGERYAVALCLETPEAVHPMAIEYLADEATKHVDLTDGEGYISAEGKRWVHVEDIFACNLCIKAYTNIK